MKWNVPNNNEVLKEIEDFNFSKSLLLVLQSRGLNSTEAITEFLDKNIRGIHNPDNLYNIEKVVDRIQKAVDQKEKIMIYGDYDVDGITGVTIFIQFFRFLNINPQFYIPHRIDEGYGLSETGIKQAKEKNISLIITVDTGITNIKEVKLAKDLGMDIIITDHHTPQTQVPDAFAIINPKQKECEYPNKYLSGVGVAFKIIHATLRKLPIDEKRCKTLLKNLLDYVTLGTIADQVHLTGENRRFVANGLKQISFSEFPGIRIIMDSFEYSNSICNAQSVAFKVTPKLNAAGRMDHSKISAKLLIEEDPIECRRLYAKIESLNRDRQKIEEQNLELALKIIEQNPKYKKASVIVINSTDFHPGVSGIIASRIAEKFYRPAIVFSSNNKNQLIGSVRSVAQINIYECIESCKDLCLSFGGHNYAAGLTITPENLDQFEKDVNTFVSKKYSQTDFMPYIDIDAEISFKEISPEFIEDFKMMEPFGFGNKTPIFLTKKAVLKSKPKFMKGKHVKFYIAQGNYSYEVIGFHFAKKVLDKKLKSSDKIDIVYNIGFNSWLGQEKIQLLMLDYDLNKG